MFGKTEFKIANVIINEIQLAHFILLPLVLLSLGLEGGQNDKKSFRVGYWFGGSCLVYLIGIWIFFSRPTRRDTMILLFSQMAICIISIMAAVFSVLSVNWIIAYDEQFVYFERRNISVGHAIISIITAIIFVYMLVAGLYILLTADVKNNQISPRAPNQNSTPTPLQSDQCRRNSICSITRTMPSVVPPLNLNRSPAEWPQQGTMPSAPPPYSE